MRRRRPHPRVSVVVPLSPAQRALDPLGVPSPRARAALLTAALSSCASFALHAALVVLGLVAASALARPSSTSSPRPVTIELRSVEPLQEPAIEPPPPDAEREAPKPERRPMRVPARPTPPPASMPSLPPAPPPEPAEPIVGLRPESFVAGATGPKLTAGQTLEGATASVARAPEGLARADGNAPFNQQPAYFPGAGPALTLPRRKRPAKPPYPPLLERQGVEADVLVRVSLDREGRVAQVTLVRPAAQAEFNHAARVAALAEQFEPARRGGEPIPYSLSFTYRFRLETR